MNPGTPPAVSVIIPAYNASKTIEATIHSVLAQTFSDFELIVIDDCSADATFNIAEKLLSDEPRARIFRNSKNKGVAFSRNYGVSAAQGDWIAFLDSDDLWCEDKLQRQLDFMGETGADISYTASAFIDAGGRPFKYILPAAAKLTYRELLKRNLMSCSSVMVRRGIMARYKMGEGEISEDYAAWLQIVREVDCAYGLNEPLLLYRLSGTSRSGKRVKWAFMTYQAYRYVGYNTLVSAMLVLRYALHSIRKRYGIRKHGMA
jgi:teichuronic acid biosynthesis glycosyltransferase TuaG